MATYYSDVRTALQGKPASMVQGTLRGGKVRTRVSKIEAAALAAGSLLEMDSLPVGARLLEGRITYDALGGSSTLALGDGTTANKYLAATSTASAGSTELTVPISAVENGYTAEEKFILTTAGASITGTVMLILQYVEATD